MRTCCPKGHPYAGDNLIVDSASGASRCRTCRADQHEQRKVAARSSLAIAVGRGGTESAVPLLPRIGDRIEIIAGRFWPRLDYGDGPEGCWPWTGARLDSGYGRVMIKRELPEALAHRLAWVLHHHADPDQGMAVLHRCDNPPCCNPAHLFLGTDADNVADMMNKGRARPGGYPLRGAA